MSRDIFSDVAALFYPLPPLPEPHEEDYYAVEAQRDALAEEQRQIAEAMRISWEEGQQDPLIGAVIGARRAMQEAEQLLRQLIAYGREFVQPRPYTLGDLAAAAGMSISGVRTAYAHRDVNAVAEAIGAKPREWRVQDPDPKGDVPA